MGQVSLKRLGWRIGLLAAALDAGCRLPPAHKEIDHAVQQLSDQKFDETARVVGEAHPPASNPTGEVLTPRPQAGGLQIPPEIPGSEANLNLPHLDKSNRKPYDAALDRLFPPLPSMGSSPRPVVSPAGRPLTLSDLQRMAAAGNPVLQQATADVVSARGAAIQAGLYTNPTIGYETDQIATAGTAGQQGAFIDQIITTGGKLKLAQAAATMDLFNAGIALRRAQVDLASRVRTGYYAMLVAQEGLRVNEALAQFTEEAFRLLVGRLKAGEAPAYEPLSLEAVTYQARLALVQSRNRYLSAWKQLAAALGQPELPPTELAGRADMPIPRFQYDAALARIVEAHTDVLTAQNTILKQRYNLQLAKITPLPDVDVRVTLQRDLTTPPFTNQANLAVGVKLPIWDRNQGGILQAQGQLVRAERDVKRARLDLTTSLAVAFESYENNRRLVTSYRTKVLPAQVVYYRGVLNRAQQEPDKVGFADIINAQQTLGTFVATYLQALSDQWTAVVNIAQLLQYDDLYQGGAEACEPGLPTLEQLLPAPGTWPSAAPENTVKAAPHSDVVPVSAPMAVPPAKARADRPKAAPSPLTPLEPPPLPLPGSRTADRDDLIPPPPLAKRGR